MKRIGLSFLGVLLCLTARAQEQEQNPVKVTPRHNLEISFGGPASGLQGLGNMSYSDYSERYQLKNLYEEQEEAYGDIVLGVQYNYVLKEWLSVGADASWGHVTATIRPGYAYRQDNNDDMTSLHQNLISVMPSVRARWLYENLGILSSNVKFGLYSKLSAGACLSVGNYKATQLRPAWEIVLTEWTLGTDRAYFFEEIGVGTNFIVRLGVGFSL